MVKVDAVHPAYFAMNDHPRLQRKKNVSWLCAPIQWNLLELPPIPSETLVWFLSLQQAIVVGCDINHDVMAGESEMLFESKNLERCWRHPDSGFFFQFPGRSIFKMFILFDPASGR